MNALHVLVVEDDGLIGMLLAEVLEGMGCSVCGVAASEAEAVAAAIRFRPDVMIVDALLGTGSGVAAVEKILRTDYIPHVFVSGDAASVRRRKPHAIVLQKPYREADLAGAIRRAMRGAVVS